jgi:hypothetical protein
MNTLTDLIVCAVATVLLAAIAFTTVSAQADNAIARMGPAVRLYQNHPNPFNPRTVIPFSVTRPTRVKLAVFGENGRHVRTLIDRDLEPGRYQATWDGRDGNGKALRAGVYYYRLQADQTYNEGRAIVLK